MAATLMATSADGPTVLHAGKHLNTT